jgi:hypothetical protein
MVRKEHTKRYSSVGLYEEDWQRIDRNREKRETQIGFIEEALQLLFDVREGKAKVSRMSSLV